MISGFDHSVKDDQELAHTSGEDDFGLFTLGFESLSELSDNGIGSVGGQRGHVEGRSKARASALNMSLTAETTAVTVHGCDADEGCGLRAIEFADFRKFDE